MTNRHRIPTLALLAATSVLLAGCTFQIRDPDSQRDEPEAPQTSEATDAPDRDDEADDEADTEISDDRAEYIEIANQTLTCDGELEIDEDGASVRVEGPCDSLLISGDAVMVVADDVDTLRITASGALVYALEVESIELTGDVNTVYWTGATPSTDDSGAANDLGKDS